MPIRDGVVTAGRSTSGRAATEAAKVQSPMADDQWLMTNG
jgi:hypothetical protein